MRSFIIITDNSESYIQDVICSIGLLREDEELIIYDNHSTDNTFSIIVSTYPLNVWIDEKERYKFMISTKKESYEDIKRKAFSIAKYKPILIDKKEKFELKELIKDVENK